MLASKRFALAIEQNRITFDLGQRKVRFVRGDDEFQQLRYDVGSVINLRGPSAARRYGMFRPSGLNDMVSVPRMLFEAVLHIDFFARWLGQ